MNHKYLTKTSYIKQWISNLKYKIMDRKIILKKSSTTKARLVRFFNFCTSLFKDITNKHDVYREQRIMRNHMKLNLQQNFRKKGK